MMKRKDFLKTIALLPLAPTALQLQGLHQLTSGLPVRAKKMPVLFIGHGHPMNAILDNSFTQHLSSLGTKMDQPEAILVISAHWETIGTYVSVNPAPKAIYDFGRFDDRLFQVQYAPPGHPELARELVKEVQSVSVQEDAVMGLDHGAWTVLKFLFPRADIPVFQMSIDYSKPAAFHYQLATELKALRSKGVLVIGSGNIVHNLGLVDWHHIDAPPYDWALEFDALVKNKIDHNQIEDLVRYTGLGTAAQLSVPTNDHYLPMLYSLGLKDKDEPVTYTYEGYQYAGIGMRCFQVG